MITFTSGKTMITTPIVMTMIKDEKNDNNNGIYIYINNYMMMMMITVVMAVVMMMTFSTNKLAMLRRHLLVLMERIFGWTTYRSSVHRYEAWAVVS